MYLFKICNDLKNFEAAKKLIRTQREKYQYKFFIILHVSVAKG